MKKEIVHVFLDLKIQCGEYEFNSKAVHSFTTNSKSVDKEIERFAKNYADDFYGEKSYSEGEWNYFHGGEVAVRVERANKITEAEYETLNKIL